MDKFAQSLRFAGRRTPALVPRYFLYGETEPTGDWFVNVEPLDQRCREVGWVIAPHSHPRFVQIMFVLSGSGTMTAEGQSYEFAAPALLVIPMHTIHGFRYQECSAGWVLTISERHLEVLAKRAPELTTLWSAPGAITHSDTEWTQLADATLRSLDRELDEGALGSVIAADALLTTLLVLVLRQFARAGELGPAAISGGAVELVARYRALIDEHYRANWPLAEYARHLNISMAQLRGACLSATGQAPLKLVQERVLVEAKRNLIYSAQSIAKVAYQVGFEDPAYFSRFFTHHVGESPAQFRARNAFAHPAG